MFGYDKDDLQDIIKKNFPGTTNGKENIDNPLLDKASGLVTKLLNAGADDDTLGDIIVQARDSDKNPAQGIMDELIIRSALVDKANEERQKINDTGRSDEEKAKAKRSAFQISRALNNPKNIWWKSGQKGLHLNDASPEILNYIVDDISRDDGDSELVAMHDKDTAFFRWNDRLFDNDGDPSYSISEFLDNANKRTRKINTEPYNMGSITTTYEKGFKRENSITPEEIINIGSRLDTQKAQNNNDDIENKIPTKPEPSKIQKENNDIKNNLLKMSPGEVTDWVNNNYDKAKEIFQLKVLDKINSNHQFENKISNLPKKDRKAARTISNSLRGNQKKEYEMSIEDRSKAINSIIDNTYNNFGLEISKEKRDEFFKEGWKKYYNGNIDLFAKNLNLAVKDGILARTHQFDKNAPFYTQLDPEGEIIKKSVSSQESIKDILANKQIQQVKKLQEQAKKDGTEFTLMVKGPDGKMIDALADGISKEEANQLVGRGSAYAVRKYNEKAKDLMERGLYTGAAKSYETAYEDDILNPEAELQLKNNRIPEEDRKKIAKTFNRVFMTKEERKAEKQALADKNNNDVTSLTAKDGSVINENNPDPIKNKIPDNKKSEIQDAFNQDPIKNKIPDNKKSEIQDAFNQK